MFGRYTQSARRAVFYARAIALLNEADAINSIHLLGGLIWESHSRASSLFNLIDIFPIYRGFPHKFVDMEKFKNIKGPPLAVDGRKVIAHAQKQSDAMSEYWIDTEHILLGILSEPACAAAQNLAKAGITWEDARRIVLENKFSRPDYRLSSELSSPSSRLPKYLKMKWLLWKYRKTDLKA